MKRIIILALALVLLLAAFDAKGYAASASETKAEEKTTAAAEGFDILGGTWTVGAVYYKNKVIDIHDAAGLADLYDSVYLSFQEDGTFTHFDLWIYQGEYTPIQTKKDCFLLTRRTKTVLKDGELREEAYSGNTKHILSVVDENTFVLAEYDPMTGAAKANQDPLIYVRQDESSEYVDGNKIAVSEGTEEKQPTEKPTGSLSSYESILNTYTQKMKDAVPGLVASYRSEAAGISDIGRLALICNNKVGELSSICNEGIGKMAEQMYSAGDSYSVYEKWAGKLMDNYMDIAMEIQNAYLDSAIS